MRGRIFGRDLPDWLFKYRALESEQQRAWFRDTLLRHEAYWATPPELNDPFDCAPTYRAMHGAELAANVRAIVKRVQPELNRTARLAREKELLRTDKATLEQRLSEVRRTMQETAVLSLASNSTSILMWSHYSAAHQGVCLKFDAGRLYEEYTPQGLLGLPVTYSDDRPVIVVGGGEEPQELMRKVFLVKSRAWEYEGEWRYVHYRGNSGLRRFPARALTAIILGARITSDTEQFVRAVAAERAIPITIQRAVIDPARFQLDIVEA